MGTGDTAAARRQEQFAEDTDDGTLAAFVSRLRRQLASSEEMATIGRMTAGIAQEINTPLTSLLGSLSSMTDLVQREHGATSPEDVARLRDAVSSATTIVDRIKDLVSAIRSLSYRDHRNAVFFDPARAIRNATKTFAVVNHNVSRVDLTIGALPALHGSPTGLSQVILNLLQNGLDASRELHPDARARLAVVATATPTEVQIAVSDDGAGIPPEIAPRVFDEFFTSKGAGARGLGLYLSRAIVREMRGSIAFESAPGRTVFTVRLPAD